MRHDAGFQRPLQRSGPVPGVEAVRHEPIDEGLAGSQPKAGPLEPLLLRRAPWQNRRCSEGKPTAQDMKLTYEMALLVLFRLRFVAYAEDKDLVPYRTHGARRSAITRFGTSTALKEDMENANRPSTGTLVQADSLVAQVRDYAFRPDLLDESEEAFAGQNVFDEPLADAIEPETRIARLSAAEHGSFNAFSRVTARDEAPDTVIADIRRSESETETLSSSRRRLASKVKARCGLPDLTI